MIRICTQAGLVVFVAAVHAVAAGAVETSQPSAAVTVTLNGLEITVDPDTGGVLRLALSGQKAGETSTSPMAMLEARPGEAGLLEVNYPIERFEPLRLAAQFSHGAQVQIDKGSTDFTWTGPGAQVQTRGASLTIHWPRLGASRPFEIPGDVAATVKLQAAPDGKSIVMSCEVENRSKRPVPQVTFPDLRGLLPFAGQDGTELRMCSLVTHPWQNLRVGESDQFYAVDASYAEYTTGGGCLNSTVGRWLDLGGLGGGLSLFPRRWGWDPPVKIATRLSEVDNRLRLMCVHAASIAPGSKWSSGEFVLTPHRNGWAKGIEPYRAWVREHVKREFPMPRRIREGLGFRSIWMCQNQPADPTDAIWKFSDLPAVAREAKEHGLDELVLWSWNRGFVIPFGEPYPHLGTQEDLIKAAAACREMGVNVAPFISVLQLNKETAPRFGMQVNTTSGWTYHTELVPRFNPGYATGFACVQVDTANAKWQDGVAASCAAMAKLGLASICWDQYWPAPGQPNMTTLMRRIRSEAIRHDPEASFSGEEVSNMEISCSDLDYTWNWRNYIECQAFTNAFPSPRMNINVNTSVESVKLGFMENLYLNVWPKKPDSINGSDTIGNHKALSDSLKVCAKLRRQFLPYFVDGTLIGSCVLSEPSPGAHVAAYVLPERMLVMVMNRTGGPLSPTLHCDLEAWLPAAPNGYAVETFDETGRSVSQSDATDAKKLALTAPLKPMEMALLELSKRK